MRVLPASACFLATLSLCTAGWAEPISTTVQPLQGTLSINHGKGFLPVKARVAVTSGDRVMVSPRGSAMVVYADGCKVDVKPGTVMAIAPLSPCASGSYAQANTCDNPAYRDTHPLICPVGFFWEPVAFVAVGAGVIAAAAASSVSSTPAIIFPVSP